jgi:hypothetical protein
MRAQRQYATVRTLKWRSAFDCGAWVVAPLACMRHESDDPSIGPGVPVCDADCDCGHLQVFVQAALAGTRSRCG